MAEKGDKVPEDVLQDLALDAQGSVGAVVQLVDTVHRHKLAAKTNQVALATEVYNLKQKHKSLKKGSQALVKAQKKGKVGPLGGIAREITATLFPTKQSSETGEENEKASAPPMPEKEEKIEPPPSYEDPEGEAEANVTSAEVDAAREEWTRRRDKATDKQREATSTARQTASFSGRGFGAYDTPEVSRLREKAQKAWDKAEEAKQQYHQLRLLFQQEQQELRREAGECGSEYDGSRDSRRSSESCPSVDVVTEYKNGQKQVIIQERPRPELWSSKSKDGLLYPRLDGKEEGELTFGGEPIPKKKRQSTPNRPPQSEEECKTEDTGSMCAQNQLRIQDIRRVVIPLIPGNEIAWAVLTGQAVGRVKKGEEAMLLQALMPQLSTHPEVAAQATMLLVQAANNPEKGKEVLIGLLQWIQSRYKLTPRQKRASFIQKLKDMQWTWQVNPADVLTGIMTTSQLTWDEVIGTPVLREELEAIMGSKMDISLHLQITKRDPKEWRKAITEVWEKVKDRTAMKPVEIYMHEGEDDSDSDDEEMICNAEMARAAVAQAHLPKVKTNKIDLRNFDRKLDMVVSALQAQEISKSEQPAQGAPAQPTQNQNVPVNNQQQPNQGQGMQDQRPPLRCYWCHQEGHIKRNCPQRNNRGPGNGYSGRGGWNTGRGGWNSGRGGWNGRGSYNQNRGNWNQNRGYGYNSNEGNEQGGYPNQNPQYRGYRGNGRGPPVQGNDKPTWESEAERVRREIIQQGKPKASWAEPPPPPADDQPAIAADHAEANFVQGLNASERWKSETLRPPLAYEQAMAQLADSAPRLQPMEMPGVDFLGQS